MWADRHAKELQRYADAFGLPSTDEQARAWTMRLAEYFAFFFPTEGWGTKRADMGRPLSTDVICTRSPFFGYDVLLNQGTPHQRLDTQPRPLALDGQVFIAVTPRPHLPPAPPVVVPPVVVPPVKPSYPYPDENTFWQAFQDRMRKAYSDKGRAFPDPNDPDAFRRFARAGYDIGMGMEPNAAATKHINALRQELGV